MTDQNVTAVINNILSKYLIFINETSDILSLLYDVDLLPEQITTVRDAIHMAAICIAYQKGAGTYNA